MKYNKFSRGSEWRKWDLHIHTPESVLENGFGNDWDLYVQKLFRKAIEHDIHALGITDYFSLEGYKRLKNDYLHNTTKLKQLFNDDEINQISKILVLPNIEFRLDKLVDESRVNFHVIFSDEIPLEQLEENFLHELDFTYEGNPQSEEERWKLKLSNLESLGRRLKKEHRKFKGKSDLYTGMINAVVSDTQISKILSSRPSIFKSKYLISIPSDEDLSSISWDGQGHQSRKVLIQKADCLMCSNPRTIQWGLGELYDHPKEYISEFKSLKPCIWGSDAHTFDELFEKNADRLVWIKADLTFQGLYQIKFEPKERVFVGSTRPEIKRPYYLIDNVCFLDGGTLPKFGSSEIPINQNLTVVIGGKSTGKSLLLYHIAKTIDPVQVQDKISQIESDDLKYDFEDDSDFDFRVTWKDRGFNRLKSSISDETKRQITYIPQHYLSNLSRKRNFEDKKSLNNFISETLLSDDESRIQEKRVNEISHEKGNSISNSINDLLGHLEDLRRQRKVLKEKGDKEGIQKYISEVKREIDSLQKQSKLSQEETERLENLSRNVQQIQNQLKEYDADINTINSFSEKARTLTSRLQNVKDEYFNYLNHETSQNHFQREFQFINNLSDRIEESRVRLVEESGFITDLITDSKTSLEKNQSDLRPLLNSIQQKSELEAKSKILGEEEGKLNSIEIQEKLIKEKEKSMKMSFDKIFSEYQDIFLAYKDYKDALLKAKEELHDIQISVSLAFNNENFSQQIRDNIQKIDLRKIYPNDRGPDGDFLYNYQSFEEHVAFVKILIRNLLNGKVKLYKGKSLRESISSLIDDYFFLNFSVSYKNDPLEKMSPGKRNLVLLKIIIEKNNQEWPILIDQPEDDLDNRSVYDDLVHFLRQKRVCSTFSGN